MPTNIEIKTVVRDWDKTCKRAESLSDVPLEILNQEDTFFVCPTGRLKLRQFSNDHGELIAYHREDLAGTKSSRYLITKTTEPETLRQVLADSLGIVGTVKKQRYLYLNGQTRIHLDKVEGLGTFLELEVVMKSGQSPSEGEQMANDLMEKLEIKSIKITVITMDEATRPRAICSVKDDDRRQLARGGNFKNRAFVA